LKEKFMKSFKGKLFKDKKIILERREDEKICPVLSIKRFSRSLHSYAKI